MKLVPEREVKTMQTRPLPVHLQQRLTAAEKFAHALLPGASRIDYLDYLATTKLRWHFFQVYANGTYGVMQFDEVMERFRLEFPYQSTLWQYNAVQQI